MTRQRIGAELLGNDGADPVDQIGQVIAEIELRRVLRHGAGSALIIAFTTDALSSILPVVAMKIWSRGRSQLVEGSKMEFGYFTLSDNHYENNDRSSNQFVADITAEALYADKLGMHSAWIGEHHFNSLGVLS